MFRLPILFSIKKTTNYHTPKKAKKPITHTHTHKSLTGKYICGIKIKGL